MQNLEPYFSETPGFFTVILIHSAIVPLPVLKCFSMPPVWFSFIAPELLCKSYMITTSLYALHYISGFFLIMSPAEGLHFSALVCLFVCLFVCHRYIYSPGCHSAAFTA